MRKIKNKIMRIILLIASFVLVSCVTALIGSGWNVKTARLINGVFIEPAYAQGNLFSESNDDYLYIGTGDSFDDKRLLTPADAINDGDKLYVKMVLSNDSNIDMFCRFKIEDTDATVNADYKFFFEQSLGETLIFNDGDGWYYYATALEPDTDYTVWLEIELIEKFGSAIVVGTPYADMVQAKGNEVVLPGGGWLE